MKTLYDVQQLLEKYGILVHIGKRIWDIELMALELDNINKAGLIDQHDYMTAKLILRREYRIEELNEKKKDKKNNSK
ncbi:YqgQ family protein [Lactobacillus amylovorus]|uniref:YqgQ family protein n=1 Tax=Lactobacillus amylovorus TaxID=1604 RepID=UPI00232C345F|nr:YqgQ family protein [Lactobacillus amylovorus]MDB6226437.1 YqgQ family protein [Lactobacillus amylovorus]